MSKFIYTLYKTVNQITDHFYIGIHKINVEKYPDYNDGYLGSGNRIINQVKKYGKDSFKRTILVIANDPKYIASLEEQMVDHEMLNDPLCLNIALGGRFNVKGNKGNKGKIVSDETKRKMSEAAKRRDPPSEETRKKISNSRKGQHRSEETNEKMKLYFEEYGNPMTGKHHSDEAKKKMSEAAKGRVISEDTKNKISESTKGRVVSEDTKKKMSESMKGKKNVFGMIWINNEKETRRINPKQLDDFISQGFQLGRKLASSNQ